MTDFDLCTEGVTRRDEFQPCNQPAVAMRLDPADNYSPAYPVCGYHARAPMLRLIDAARLVSVRYAEREAHDAEMAAARDADRVARVRVEGEAS